MQPILLQGEHLVDNQNSVPLDTRKREEEYDTEAVHSWHCPRSSERFLRGFEREASTRE